MSSAPTPHPDAVRSALAEVISSPGFTNSERMVRFLRYVVEKTLAGDPDAIKEYTLGIEVFDRDPSFDPKMETIVRVEARRLRRKLQEYYDGPRGQASIRIEMPSPGYAPVFSVLESASPNPAEPEPKPRKPRFAWLAVAGGLLAVGLIGAAYWSMRPTTNQLNSVAVLAFANLSGDPNLEYFSDGFSEEVIDRLTSIPDLRVAARTSAFEFKKNPLDIREIGRRLNVDALVEGSIRRGGDTVRITAQLVRSSDGIHIWSKSWDRPLKDVLAVETEIATAIAESFQRSLASSRSSAGVPPSLEAHDLYLLGRYHWNQQEPEELERAIAYFNQAIARSPDYALAYSGLSEVYSYQIDLDFAPTAEVASKARAAADRALVLDDALAEAHTSRGLVAVEADWDFARAEREFQRALQLKPGFAYGIHWYAHYFEYLGRPAEGLPYLQRAIALDPLSRMYRLDLSANYYQQRQFDQALAEVERGRTIEREWPLFDLATAVAYLARGDNARAVESARSAAQKLGPMPLAMVTLIQAEAASGNQAAARAELLRMQQAATQGYVPAFAFSLAHYALGNREEGFQWLQRAFDQRNGGLMWMRSWPLFDPVKKDPRAKLLLDRVGVNRP
ncbi:MAG: hypothetical protein ABI811_15470 [Acidobacteriota bacterium]